MSFNFLFSFLLLILNKPFGVLSLPELANTPLHVCCPIGQANGSGSYLESLDCDKEILGRKIEYRPSPYVWRAPSQILDSVWNGSANFKLLQENITCNTGRKIISIPITGRLSQLEVDDSIDPTQKAAQRVITIGRNGYLNDDGLDYYHKNEFCLNKFNSSFIEILTCEPNCPVSNKTSNTNSVENKIAKIDYKQQRTTACVRKCCAAGSILTFRFEEGVQKFKCSPSNVIFKPKIYSGSDHALSTSEHENIDIHIRKDKFTCTGPPGTKSGKTFFALGPKVAKENHVHQLCFRLQKDGTAYYHNNKLNWKLASDYCIDVIANFRNESLLSEVSQEHEMGVIMCSIPSEDMETVERVNTRRKLYGGFMISVSVFLLLTFIVYALLWDQRGLHGWTTMGHSSSMFFMYIFLGTAHILTVADDKGSTILGKFSCVITGVLAHFFFLSTFCWFTLICFDLWFTFKSFSPKSSRSKGIKRFVYYVFFGWGVPTAVIITSLVLDSFADDMQCGNLVYPRYGQLSCFVAEVALGEYVYYPIASLLLLNLILFSVTTWKIYQYKQSTRMATSNMENNQQFFKLCIRLYFVMGFSWIFEVISWLHVGTATPWYWTILDFINVFQALATFVIYVCKRETILALDKKYPRLKPHVGGHFGTVAILGPIMKLFKWKQISFDAEQSSSLNTSSQRSHERTRESALSDDSVRISTMYSSVRRSENGRPT